MKTKFFRAMLGCIFLLLAIAAIAETGLAQTCAQPPGGIISWWPGDGNAVDIIGDNNGAIGNETTFASGLISQAFSFDGVNDYVTVNSKFDTEQSFSIDCWMKLRSFQNDPLIAVMRSRSEGYVNDFGIFVPIPGSMTPGDQRLQFNLMYPTSNGTGAWIVLVGPEVPIDVWTHAAFTYDANSKDIRLYVNGTLQNSKNIIQDLSAQGFLPISTVTEDLLVFGADYWGFGRFAPGQSAFPGELDEIGLYNTSLTQDQIQSIFNAGGAGKCRYETLQVTMDIKPGSFPNSINPRSNGVIPVAILSTDRFDATSVDPTTVLIGKIGASVAPERFSLLDVNRDGVKDILFHFNTQATDLMCGDTLATLTGKTFDGQAIEGTDSIQTVGCK